VRKIFIFLFFSKIIFANDFTNVLVINDDLTSISFEQYVSFLGIDQEIPFEEILNKNFLPVENNPFYKGYTKKIYWFRFKIRNDSKKIMTIYFRCCHYNTDIAYLYIISNDQFLQIIKMGDKIPIEQWIFPSREILFPLTLEPQQEYTYYLKIQTTSKLEISFYLYNSLIFKKLYSQEYLIIGIFLGFIFLIILMTLYLNFSVKTQTTIYLILFMIFYYLGLISILGLGWEFLWGFFPYWNDRAHLFFMNLALIFSYKFMALFYKNYENIYKYKLIFRILSFVNIIIILISFFGFTAYMNRLTFLVVILVFFTSFVLSLQSVRYKIIVEQQITYGWLILIVSILLYVINQLNILPKNYTYFFNEDFLLFTSTIFFLFLIIGVLKEYSLFRLTFFEYDAQLKITESLQKEFLPKDTPSNFYYIYIPLFKVSGDFIYYKKNNQNLFVIVADVQGHGIGSSVIVGMLKIILDFLKEWNELDQILNYLYKNIKNYLSEISISLNLLKIDESNGNVEILRCGGEYPIIIKNNKKIITITSKGTLIHSTFFIFPEKENITLEKNDLILLFTDGLRNFLNYYPYIKPEEFYEFIYDLFFIKKDKNEIYSVLYQYFKESKKYQDDDLSLVIYKYD